MLRCAVLRPRCGCAPGALCCSALCCSALCTEAFAKLHPYSRAFTPACYGNFAKLHRALRSLPLAHRPKIRVQVSVNHCRRRSRGLGEAAAGERAAGVRRPRGGRGPAAGGGVGAHRGPGPGARRDPPGPRGPRGHALVGSAAIHGSFAKLHPYSRAFTPACYGNFAKQVSRASSAL